jgi:hypothetical protein
MSEIFCGIGKIPKGKRRGTMMECAQKKQIKLFGLYKIDPKILEEVDKVKLNEKTRSKLMIRTVSVSEQLKKDKVLLKKKNITDKEMDDIKKRIEKNLKELKEINNTLDKLENKKTQKGGSNNSSDELQICD